MKLFTYDEETGDVVVNEPALELMTSFKEYFTNARNKIAGDTQGRLKKKAKAELLYIYLRYDPYSPLAEAGEEEKEVAAMEESGLINIKGWKPDKLFDQVKERYIELYITATQRLLTSVKKSVYAFENYFEGITFDDDDYETNKMKNYILALEKLDKVLEAVQKMEIKVSQERNTATEVYGDQEKGFRD